MPQPANPNPYDFHGRDWFPLQRREDGQTTSAVYLCDDPDVGIGWRLREIVDEGDGEVQVTEGEITARKAHELITHAMWAHIVESTQRVGRDVAQEWPEAATRLADGARR